VKKLNFIVYGLFGGGAFLIGIAGLLFPSMVVEEAGRDSLVSHLVREEAAAAVFIGCMLFSCIFNYERRNVVHYFLIVFTFLMAAIHWFDFLRGHKNWVSPIINSVPVLVLTMMALLSRSEAGVRKHA
jgi:uncharacterized membrane protein